MSSRCATWPATCRPRGVRSKVTPHLAERGSQRTLEEVERTDEVDLVPAVVRLCAEPISHAVHPIYLLCLRHRALVTGDREDAVVAPRLDEQRPRRDEPG